MKREKQKQAQKQKQKRPSGFFVKN